MSNLMSCSIHLLLWILIQQVDLIIKTMIISKTLGLTCYLYYHIKIIYSKSLFLFNSQRHSLKNIWCFSLSSSCILIPFFFLILIDCFILDLFLIWCHFSLLIWLIILLYHSRHICIIFTVTLPCLMLCHMHDLYMEIFFHFGWLLTCHNWESLARCNIINNCWIHLICTFISYTRHTRSFLFQISQAISLLLNAHRHHTPRRTWGWIVVETNVKHYLWWFLFTVCDAVPFSFRLCFLLLVWSYSDNITHITTILNQKSLFVCWPKSETMVGFQHRGGCRVTPWSCVWRWWFGLWERRPTMTTYNYLQLQIIKNPTWKRGKGRRSGRSKGKEKKIKYGPRYSIKLTISW